MPQIATFDALHNAVLINNDVLRVPVALPINEPDTSHRRIVPGKPLAQFTYVQQDKLTRLNEHEDLSCRLQLRDFASAHALHAASVPVCIMKLPRRETPDRGREVR